MSRESFIFYGSWVEAVRDLPNEVRLEIYDGIMEYAISGKCPDFKPMAKIAFNFIKNDIDNSVQNTGYGELHWNWKGGISNENAIIRGSSKMRTWRLKVYEKDNYTCQHCHKIDVELNAHHIYSFAEYPELRFDVSNGITLCKPCHIKEHKRLRNAKR
ncbi:HNH endonuclease [Elizabethkingia anophelis]|uniref:DUF6291 domain-containing protein n=1 Tax=Elizabethkingia anophelis TaxID=1117645 RepID=UPI00293D068B|nr:HNH endonuclease [Elizabethkingia anophelis]MDV3904957.1 HNH endonuclease [Elizabethkingia anophelis]